MLLRMEVLLEFAVSCVTHYRFVCGVAVLSYSGIVSWFEMTRPHLG